MIGSAYFRNRALDACYGDGHSSAWPSSLRVRVFHGDPAAGGTEITGGGYAPVTYANTTANFPDADEELKTHATDVTFPESTGAWSATGDWWAITDAAGNVADYGQLSEHLDIDAAGITPVMTAGSMTIGTT